MLLGPLSGAHHLGRAVHTVIPRNTFGGKKKGNWMLGAVVAAEASPERKLGNDLDGGGTFVFQYTKQAGAGGRGKTLEERVWPTPGGKLKKPARPLRALVGTPLLATQERCPAA